jgi:hypothetical protein
MDAPLAVMDFGHQDFRFIVIEGGRKGLDGNRGLPKGLADTLAPGSDLIRLAEANKLPLIGMALGAPDLAVKDQLLMLFRIKRFPALRAVHWVLKGRYSGNL